MKKLEVALRLVDAYCLAHGIPSGVITKIIEEAVESDLEETFQITESANLDKGNSLMPLGSAKLAIAAFFNKEIPEEYSRTRLMKEWSKLNYAYSLYELRPAYNRYLPEAAKLAATVHHLLGHHGMAKDWVQAAIKQNAAYHYPEDHAALEALAATIQS
ncbi:MAG: hypothetical protein KME52_28895 [Desmonostoc geniculatum HA4340-LM1]|jgi:hypothetical protein|nr:hypothetical protein [Desmonostoc geniculatum HA4340-LM1]